METSNLDIKLTCRGCGTLTPLKKLKYDQQERLMCGNCQDRGKIIPDPVKQVRNEMKGIKAQDLITPPTQAKKPSVKKVPYTCKKCHYKFTIKVEGGYAVRCPFCGRTDYLQKDDEFTTSKLIREVSEHYGFD